MGSIILVLVFVAFLWALAAQSAIIRYLARSLAALVALAAAAASVGLFMLGMKAHWTSDGPAMLFVMLGIPLFGLVALFFGTFALSPRATPDIATPDIAPGSLTSAKAWELFKAITKRPPLPR